MQKRHLIKFSIHSILIKTSKLGLEGNFLNLMNYSEKKIITLICKI